MGSQAHAEKREAGQAVRRKKTGWLVIGLFIMVARGIDRTSAGNPQDIDGGLTEAVVGGCILGFIFVYRFYKRL